MTHFLRSLPAAAVATLVAAPLAPAQQLPPAGEIIDRYVEAIGGREAYLAPQSLRMIGTFGVPAAGLTGSFTLISAKPDRMKMQVDLPGVGEILSGYDGEIGWSVNPMTGAMVFEGERLMQTREEARFISGLRDASLFQSRETVGEAESQGQPCWEVKLVWTSGRETVDCYSKESGLLLQSRTTAITDMGNVHTTSLYADYEMFDGRRYPTRMVQQMIGQEQVMSIDSVVFNQVEPSAFTLPDAIRTLVNRP